MKICTSCGNELTNEDKFCSSCGAKAEDPPTVNENGTEKIGETIGPAEPIDTIATVEPAEPIGAVDTIEPVETNSSSQDNTPVKRKKGKGCLIAIIIVVGLVIIGALGGGGDNDTDTPTDNPTNQTEDQATDEKDKEPAPQPKAFDPVDYQTGVTYDNLARTPDSYVYSKVAFNGKVIQVIEGDGETQCRLAVDGDYDKIIFISYNPDILDSRVLENDMITIYGLSAGIISYESTFGATISVPAVSVVKIMY